VLAQNYQQLSNQFDANSEELAAAAEALAAYRARIDKALNELAAANKKDAAELSKMIGEKLDLLRKENKDFYKDLESTIKIKLDDNRSQIKQLIEGERNRIKEIFELEFARNTAELKRTVEAEHKQQAELIRKGQQSIKVTVWICGGLILAAVFAVIFKLFM
jgi:rubrerythrin